MRRFGSMLGGLLAVPVFTSRLHATAPTTTIAAVLKTTCMEDYLEEYGYKTIDDREWTPARERAAAEVLAQKHGGLLDGNSWNTLTDKERTKIVWNEAVEKAVDHEMNTRWYYEAEPRSELTKLEETEIAWLLEWLGRDVSPARREEMRSNFTELCLRIKPLKDHSPRSHFEPTTFTPLHRLVQVNASVFGRLLDRASAASETGNEAMAKHWTRAALGVAVRAHLMIAANRGTEYQVDELRVITNRIKNVAVRAVPAVSRAHTHRAMREHFWRTLLTAPQSWAWHRWLWDNDASGMERYRGWQGFEGVSSLTLDFALTLGSANLRARCGEILGSVSSRI